MEIWGFENIFLEMNGQSVVDLNIKNGMSKWITIRKLQ